MKEVGHFGFLRCVFCVWEGVYMWEQVYAYYTWCHLILWLGCVCCTHCSRVYVWGFGDFETNFQVKWFSAMTFTILQYLLPFRMNLRNCKLSLAACAVSKPEMLKSINSLSQVWMNNSKGNLFIYLFISLMQTC